MDDKNSPHGTTDLEPSTQALDIFDRMDERSVLNLLPTMFQAQLIEAQRKAPDLFGLDEKTLMHELGSRRMKPTPTDNRLRIAFWLEYDRAQAAQRKMNLGMVYLGVCSRQTFSVNYARYPEKIAWMLTPPVSYETKMSEALDFGIDRLRQILDEEIILPTGLVNMKLAELQTKIIFMLDQRLKGAVIQRIEQRSMNVNLNASSSGVAQAAMELTMEDIDKKLKELERRRRSALNAPYQVVDAPGE